jgi:transposase
MNFMLEAKLMDFHLDGLLNLLDITIERCIKNDTKTILKVGFLTDYATCPHCQHSRDELHQIRPILIRDLPISGQLIELEIPRRQYYCNNCKNISQSNCVLLMKVSVILNDMTSIFIIVFR